MTNVTKVSSTISANGNSALIETRNYRDMFLYFAVGGATGTSPTLDVVVDFIAPDGTTVVVSAAAPVDGSGVSAPLHFTATGAAYCNIGPNYFGGGAKVLPPYLKVRWTIGGTASPTFTGVKCFVYGK